MGEAMTNQTIDGVPRDPCQWTDLQILDFLGVALRNVDLVDTVKLSEIRQGFEYMRNKQQATQPQGEPVELPALLDTVQMDGYQSPYDAGWNAYGEKVLAMGPLYSEQGAPVAYRYMDCNTGTFGPTKDGGIYYAEIPEYGRKWEVTTKAHGAVLIERKEHAIANGYVDSHPSLTVIIEPLYAEQPASVAVVLPDSATTQDFGDESMANGWNACLDEVTRLNSKPSCCGSCPAGCVIQKESK